MVKILIGMNEQFFTSEQKQFCCKLVHRLWWAIFIAFVKLKILLWYYITKTANQSFVRLISYERSNVSKKLPYNYFRSIVGFVDPLYFTTGEVVKFKCHIGWQIWKVPWRLWSIAYESSTDIYCNGTNPFEINYTNWGKNLAEILEVFRANVPPDTRFYIILIKRFKLSNEVKLLQ